MSDLVVPFRLEAGSMLAEGIADDGIGDEWDARGERMALVGAHLDETVRWVALPDNLGGGRAHVCGATETDCPCGTGHPTTVLLLDRDGLCVTECVPTRRFLWWRP